MKYSAFLLIVVAALGFGSCNHDDPAKRHEAMKAHLDSLKSELLQADLAFSQLSQQKGRNASFVEYANENATMLRPFSMPVTGKENISALFNLHPDSEYVLTWVPIRADVARSGELGFTYGTYSLAIKDINQKQEGTYCTIWKRDKDHHWKFILDTGNEGLNPGDQAEDVKIKAEEKTEMKKEEKGKKK